MVTRFKIVLSVAVVVLAVGVVMWRAAPAIGAGNGGSMGPDKAYGPCCSIVQGARYTPLQPDAYWSETGGKYTGPRFTCGAPQKATLDVGGKSYPLDAVEVENTLLVPARIFGLAGAKVAWDGSRSISAYMGKKAIDLDVGSHTVKLTDHGVTTPASWDLCPRLRNDVAYVPLRPTAEALGLSVEWTPGIVKLISGAPTTEALNSADECPVTQLQDSLGITVVHGQVAGPYGPGIGVLEVNAGGNAAKLGLQPRDVILEANGQRVSCPRDLQEAMTRSHETKLAPCSLIVAQRGKDLAQVPQHDPVAPRATSSMVQATLAACPDSLLGHAASSVGTGQPQ